MFLSTASITKQLFYEFLHFEILALAPGKPCQIEPGTLLGSSFCADVGIAIQFAVNRLKTFVNTLDSSEEERQRFNLLLSELAAYKKAEGKEDNHFHRYAETEKSTTHTCAWLAFAPLFINPMEAKLTFKTQEEFLNYLKNPKIAFQFSNHSPIEQTGLYIAVKTNNYEMINAFLCPEYSNYHLTKSDLKTLLLLTDDPATRLILLTRSPELIKWISSDAELKDTCIKNFDSLSGFWPYLTEKQRKEFISATSSQLWLNLIDNELRPLQIQQLLGDDYHQLKKKLVQDESIIRSTLIPKTLNYLDKTEQFRYLLEHIDLNKTFPLPHEAEWNQLLFSLGYYSRNQHVITRRYMLPKEVAHVHDKLIQVLISLPIEAEAIIKALNAIELYVSNPETIDDYKKCLSEIAKDSVNKEYELNFFVFNWFVKLLRFLNIIEQSPLHPYLDRLTQVIQNEPVIVSSELMSILPFVADYKVYKMSLQAYRDGQIGEFWSKLPLEQRNEIIKEPLRFSKLITLLSIPEDHTEALFKVFDAQTLSYFHTAVGLHQLIVKTPSLDAKKALPLLKNAMAEHKIDFLENSALVLELLTNSQESVFQSLSLFFQPHEDNKDSLPFQENLLKSLPKPFNPLHFNRFLQAYCSKANHFSTLLLYINKENSSLVEECWNQVPKEQWDKWVGCLEYGKEWLPTLKYLELSDRIDFFEKLSSGDKLTADEFCDIVTKICPNEDSNTIKNSEIFKKLWDEIPNGQWDTWIAENQLPLSTRSLLNTMPPALRIQVFKTLLSMPQDEREALYIIENKTLDVFYPDDVKNAMSEASNASIAIAKLHALKETKQQQLNDQISLCISDIRDLPNHLPKNAENENSFSYWFFSKDPYATVHTKIKELKKLYKRIQKDPLFAIIKENAPPSSQYRILEETIQNVKEQCNTIAAQTAEISDQLSAVFLKIDEIFKTIEEPQIQSEEIQCLFRWSMLKRPPLA